MPGHTRLIPGHKQPRFRGGLWLPICNTERNLPAPLSHRARPGMKLTARAVTPAGVISYEFPT